jgi:hypothetical protein
MPRRRANSTVYADHVLEPETRPPWAGAKRPISLPLAKPAA